MTPTISVSNASIQEGETLTFNVALSEASLGQVTIQARVNRDGTAGFGSEDADTSGETFEIIIPAGDTTAQVSFTPTSALVRDEFDENFTLELSDPVNAVLEGGGPILQATGVVLDGSAGPNVALFVSDPVIYETDGNNQQAVFEVRLSQALGQNITLAYETADGSATAGSDYVAESGTLTFLAGQTVASVAVDLIGDNDVETNENFSLVVETVTGIANGTADAAGIADIIDDDASEGDLPVISISAVEAIEGDRLVFRVVLSEPSLGPVTIQARVNRDGTASFGSEDADTSGQTFVLTIPAGETVSDIVFTPTSALVRDEFDENFTIELSDPTNAVLAGGGPILQATGIVLDGSSGPNLALFVSDPVIYETDGNGQQAVFEVRLSQPLSVETTLSFQTVDGSALAGSDYVATSGDITFLPGQTVASVAVDILGDNDVETNENFSLVVGTNVAIANGTADAAGIADILDDDTDSGLPVISISAVEGLEGDRLAFRVTMSEESLTDVTVQGIVVTDGTAGLGSEDVSNNGNAFTITIPAGEVVSEVVFAPTSALVRDEFDENFTLELSNPVNAVLAGGENTLRATGVILDGSGSSNLSLFVSDPEIREGNGDSKVMVFEVRLSQPTATDLELSFTTADGSATAGQDYQATSGTITFLAGQTVAAVHVPLISDIDLELNETFSLIVTPNILIQNGTEDAAGIATIIADEIRGTSSADVLEGTTSSDAIYALGGADSVSGSAGADFIFLGSGRDEASGGTGADEIFGGIGDDDIAGGNGHDSLFGGDGADDLSGGNGNDRVFGESGNDGLAGGVGNDTLTGGQGSDNISGGTGADVISGDKGFDTLNGGNGTDQIDGGNGNDKLFGGFGADTLNGGEGKDELGGGSGQDILLGGADEDDLSGGDGDDNLSGGAGADVIGGGRGADVVGGGTGKDVLNGGNGNDKLNGGTGADTLNGGNGLDTLDGDSGADILFGGGGADTFHFDFGDGSDTIKDFQDDIDVLELDGFGLSLNQALNVADQVGSDVVFSFSNGQTLTIEDMTVTQLGNDLDLL